MGETGKGKQRGGLGFPGGKRLLVEVGSRVRVEKTEWALIENSRFILFFVESKKNCRLFRLKDFSFFLRPLTHNHDKLLPFLISKTTKIHKLRWENFEKLLTRKSRLRNTWPDQIYPCEEGSGNWRKFFCSGIRAICIKLLRWYFAAMTLRNESVLRNIDL